MIAVLIRPTGPDDRDRVNALIVDRWHSDYMVVHGTIYYPRDLPGFLAIQNDEPVGLLTYQISDSACEIVTLHSLEPAIGVGTALIVAVRGIAQQANCVRLWLITTNDNVNALRFYQKRGFRLVAVYPNALEQSRKLKPEIPRIGNDGIPLRDELELEMTLVD